MKEQKLLSVEKNLDKKFLKFYTTHYETNGKPRDYFFVSRNDEKDLAINRDKPKPTAIEAFTYRIDEKGEFKVVMIREFRSAIGKYVYSFCAGLIEEDEDVQEAYEREVKEELGAEVKKISMLQVQPMYLCPGVTDEANYFAVVRIDELNKQHLEENEDIEVVEFSLDELLDKVDVEELPLTITGYLGIFVLNAIKNEVVQDTYL